MRASPENVELVIYLMNGQKLIVPIQSTDGTNDVLEV